jgi:hypothetical protein
MSASFYFNPATERFFPDLMAGYNAYDNDNHFILDEDGNKQRLPDGWADYDEVNMTGFGPIGIIKGEGFVYLDPETKKERG